MANPQNPGPKFGSPEWQAQVDAEVKARPTTHKGPRTPITPEEFESYRPKEEANGQR
jgi:hypothetical protein